MINKFLTALGVVVLVLSGLLIFTIHIMGDRSCDVELLNNRYNQLIIKTFTYTSYDKKLTIDSILLPPGHRLEIGSCISCSIIKPSDINFDSIGIYTNDKLIIWRPKDFAEFLTKNDRIDCATFLIK